ncbi:hypothetical protein G6M87_32035 (plasmid) [Rhizobium rhizogenes]|uniref:hypothetical protein n=1 Tax=Rhizobium rhizogenes TaxID=359 RepID=UPI00157437C2|nr:hypothetical protein [Rhizobium rhizogenes]NTI26844.1 hypothetical protein [Rhizobium rhizogenes]QTG10084.1 hypothetical protein G6M87_32035 [Rhizobium rhizogenes]
MILEQHIEELRLELAASIDQDERRQIAAELAMAKAKLASLRLTGRKPSAHNWGLVDTACCLRPVGVR